MSGTSSRVIVRFEKAGRAGKAVTVVTGVPLHPEGKLALLGTLKKKLGTGGTVKDGQLELQGDHRDRIAPLLETLGYNVVRGN